MTDVLVAREDGADPFEPVSFAFVASAKAVWATSFSVDIELVSQWLVPACGAAVDVTVLVDRGRLDKLLESADPDDASRWGRVNARWLLRGVDVSGGVFHPKSLLTVLRGEVRLAVGSGNLNRDGLGGGHELFVAFESDTDAGKAAIRSWRRWMEVLVRRVKDATLAERFARLTDLIDEIVPLNEAAGDSLVVDNVSRPLLPQFFDRLPGTVADRLEVTAPFYDPDIEALTELVNRIRPRHLDVYVASDTRVNGPRLAELVEATGGAIWRYSSTPFVHAKLAVATYSTSAWVLSGSANLSRAALTLPWEQHGNVELAVIAQLPADSTRQLLTPPGLEVERWERDQLDALTFDRDDPAERADPTDVVLARAEPAHDGTLRVWINAPLPSDVAVTDGTTAATLSDSADVADAYATTKRVERRLVWLVTPDGTVVSNRTVVDDPASLARTAGSTEHQPSELPDGLYGGDELGVFGQSLKWTHQHLLLDWSHSPDDKPPSEVRQQVDTEELTADGAADLWDRIERQRLARDPRTSAYHRMWSNPERHDPMVAFFQSLLDQAGPDLSPSSASTTLPLVDGLVAIIERVPGPSWTPNRRLAVRSRNLVRRWIARTSDRQQRLVDPLAQAKNFGQLVQLLALWNAIRRSDENSPERPPRCPLTFDQLDDLAVLLITEALGDESRHGWWMTLDDPAEAAEQIPRDIRKQLAVLFYLGVAPGRPRLRDRQVAWQRPLERALELGLIDSDRDTARLAAAFTATDVSVDTLDDALLDAGTFTDDELWCQRQARQIGLPQLRLSEPPATDSSDVELRIEMAGVTDPLVDIRVPKAVVAALAYRHATSAVVWDLGTERWRLSLPAKEPAMLRSELQDAPPHVTESQEVVSRQQIKQAADNNQPLAQLLT